MRELIQNVVHLWIAAFLFANAFGQAQAPPQAREQARELFLTVGKSMVVNSAAVIERVAVGYGEVADARAVGPNEVLVNGKAPGETSLIIWQQGGNKLFFDVVVRANTSGQRQRIETLRRQLKEELPGQNITATVENDFVFLRGTAKDLVSADRAVAMAGTLGKVVNLLYVDVPNAESQILLKVQFASVDRSLSDELGLNLISTGATNTIGRMTTGQFSPPAIPNINPSGNTTVTLSDALNIFLFRRDLNLGATLRALQARSLVEILAEPNVLAINGKPASFLAGGEFPYPILQGGQGGVGTVTIAFREFGVRINFLPLITSRGTIRLGVAPEVSALDFAAGLTFQGFTVPGLTTRRVQTEVELQSGQSFAIGGLLDKRLTETMNKIPLLASIPLLGKLFQSRSLQKQNNELLVIVTPEVVRPIPEGVAPPQLEYPRPMMGPDNLPRTPGVSVTGPVPVNPPQASMPVETLLQNRKAEQDLTIEKGQNLSTWPGSQPLSWPGGPTSTAAPSTAAPSTPAPSPAPAVPPR